MIYTLGLPNLTKSKLYTEESVDHCIDFIKNADILGLDVETEGFFNFSNKIVCLQLSNGTDEYFIETRYVNYFIILKQYIEEKIILGQNLKFDYQFMKFHGIELKYLLDTFIAECILTNGLDNRDLGLDGIVKKYIGAILDKTIRNQFINLKGKPFTDKQIIYGTDDVKYLHSAYKKQLELLKEKELLNVFELECKVIKVLAEIEYTGMYLNKDKWLELSKTAVYNTKKLEAELEQEVLKEPKLKKYVKKYIQSNLFDVEPKLLDIKWSSPPQMVNLFKDLGLAIESTERKELTKYQNTFSIVKKYLDYKEEDKLSTTYGKEFLKHINPKTNRIHTNFWQILNTHRVSSSHPNIQQIPADKDYLACFEAPERFKIVGCDFSGQELRLITELTKDPLWINVFTNNGDIHSEIASTVFSIPINEVKEKPEFLYVGKTKVYLRGKSPRDIAKTINFMLAYGGSEFKLAATLGITVEEAKLIIDSYFEKVPLVKAVLDNCSRFGVVNKFIRSLPPYSIIRNFEFNSNDYKSIGEVERASKNTPIQASGAMMCKLALVNLYNKIKDVNYKVEIFLQVHDAIYCYVEEQYAEEWALIQKNIMEEAGKVFIKSIPVTSDIVIAKYWSK